MHIFAARIDRRSAIGRSPESYFGDGHIYVKGNLLP
jgi:hypothetical protein